MVLDPLGILDKGTKVHVLHGHGSSEGDGVRLGHLWPHARQLTDVFEEHFRGIQRDLEATFGTVSGGLCIVWSEAAMANGKAFTLCAF